MQPLTYVTLGDLTLAATGVPEKIPFGGKQMRGIHQMPTYRTVDAMGAYEDDITFSGLLFNDNTNGVIATDQAQYLISLRQSGNPVTLSWDAYQYTVLVAEFTPTFERYFQIAYKITCTVVSNQTSPNAQPPQSTVDDLLNGDMSNSLNSAQSLGMSVPPNNPGFYSSSVGAAPPSITAITWSSVPQ
jgi:hypothetical protein